MEANLKLTLALCAAAGALAFAMPAFADTVYDPSTGQSFVTTPSSNFTGATQGTVYVTPGTAADTSATAGPTPGYANSQGSWGGPLEIITAPVRMVTGPFAIMNGAAVSGYMQPASGAVGPVAGETLVYVNHKCGLQTDFNGKHTAMCGP